MSQSTEFSPQIPDNEALRKIKVGIAYTQWNEEIITALRDGAVRVLHEAGVSAEQIIQLKIPGTFELPLASQWLAERRDIDGVIAFGCVIKGETPHFEYICEAASQGIMTVNLKHNKPVIFGVLTTLNKDQAIDRIGGKHGHKGEEAAYSLLQMLSHRMA